MKHNATLLCLWKLMTICFLRFVLFLRDSQGLDRNAAEVMLSATKIWFRRFANITALLSVNNHLLKFRHVHHLCVNVRCQILAMQISSYTSANSCFVVWNVYVYCHKRRYKQALASIVFFCSQFIFQVNYCHGRATVNIVKKASQSPFYWS